MFVAEDQWAYLFTFNDARVSKFFSGKTLVYWNGWRQ